jgi:phenylacetate-CoA ligase
MAENLRVEVLHPDGAPCLPGQIGQVVITTLHNFAMPLIRYAIGDFAEVGDGCSCGRGLLHLRRIMGRERNMIKLPDGRWVWPIFGVLTWIADIPIRQIRFVQRQIDTIDVQYVMERELGTVEMQRITDAVRQAVGWPFLLRWERCEQMAAGPTGKFEDVVCAL